MALAGAASDGDAAEVRKLLANGANVESHHWEGSSALWWAVVSGSPETVRALLEHGADPNSRGQFDSVIDAAVEQLERHDDGQRRAIARMLLTKAPLIKDPAQLKLLQEALAKK